MKRSWDSLIDTPLVIYDFSRLLTRRNAPVATGIDRIDLAFARALAQSFGERLGFVSLAGRSGAVVDHSLALSLLDQFEQSWLVGQPPDGVLCRELEAKGLVRPLHGAGASARQTLQKGVLKARTLSNWISMPPLDAALKQRLKGEAATYIVCSHHGLARVPGLLERLKAQLGISVYAYIHDLIPIRYPEYIRPQQVGKLDTYLSELYRAGARFFSNSTASASDLEHYAREQNWHIRPVEVVLPDLPLKAPGERALLPKIRRIVASRQPYFVVLGTIEPRKNHLLLLQLWRQLAGHQDLDVPHLHIVGQRGWEIEHIVNFLERCSAIRPHVSEHADLDDTNLFHLMQSASALLFPSFAEGLGLPLLEAAALGVPVIASDLPVFRELPIEGLTLLDPLDTPGWERACREAVKRNAQRHYVP